jgi:hypothetical protein
MKTISVPTQSAEINGLLEQARQEDVIIRAPDGTEFMLTAVDEFDEEVAATRRNAKMMAFLDQRARQAKSLTLDEVKRELGLTG